MQDHNSGILADMLSNSASQELPVTGSRRAGVNRLGNAVQCELRQPLLTVERQAFQGVAQACFDVAAGYQTLSTGQHAQRAASVKYQYTILHRYLPLLSAYRDCPLYQHRAVGCARRIARSR